MEPQHTLTSDEEKTLRHQAEIRVVAFTITIQQSGVLSSLHPASALVTARSY